MPEPTVAETGDIDARAIVCTGIALLLVIAAVSGAAWLLLRGWHVPVAGPNAPLDFAVAPPMLESAPQDARVRYDAEKRSLLESYSWVDRKRGIARIPIGRAMDLVVQRRSDKGVKTR